MQVHKAHGIDGLSTTIQEHFRALGCHCRVGLQPQVLQHCGNVALSHNLAVAWLPQRNLQDLQAQQISTRCL